MYTPVSASPAAVDDVGTFGIEHSDVDFPYDLTFVDEVSENKTKSWK